MTSAIESIDIERVTKRYGRHRALADVELRLERGSLCALLGPNGAGKSTLLGIVSTLVRPSGGTLVFRGPGGKEFRGQELRRHIGVLAHEPFVYTQLNAVENLQFWGRLYNVDNLDDRVGELLERVDLDSRAQQQPTSTYSRGMVQRLALARAMLHDPSVLLLDEPFTGLDQKGALALGKTLEATRLAGRLLLVVTHDLEAIAQYAYHVVVLRRGKIQHEDRRAAGSSFDYKELRELYHRYSE